MKDMENREIKGYERERNLKKDAYFTESYFSMTQLCSLSHQINQIYKLKPSSVLEIGIGNGFVSTFLKRYGIDVCTVDINAALSPDIVCSIHDLPKHLTNRKFDLVVCCEVLEHMPFEEFEKSLEIFKMYSDKLFLTLPSYSTWIGFSGFLRIPKICNQLINVGIKISRKKDLEKNEHFWELGSSEQASRKNIKLILSKKYKQVEHGVFTLNRYHEYFVCGEFKL